MDRKYDLGPDIVEECNAVAALEEQPDWDPLFEPTSFNENHKPLTVQGYKLAEEELEVWGETCSKIREKIMARAARVSLAEQARVEQPRVEQHEEVGSADRRRRGLKRSRPADNVEGRTEADLRR